jgi:tetratricopeptide (TPR) repeat protein
LNCSYLEEKETTKIDNDLLGIQTSSRINKNMNDIVILELIKTIFWLIVLMIVVFVFRREIKLILESMGSFKVAGAAFELKDRKETLQSYILLAETLIDLLSRSDRIRAIQDIVSPSQIEKLGTFALKYTEEVGHGQWNEELLRNIALLLFRFGRYTQSLKLYDALLARRPDHYDLLNLKALALMTTRLEEKVKEAEKILSALVTRYPEMNYIRCNFALTKSLLGDHDEVAMQMQTLIECNYPKEAPDFLDDPLLHRTREDRPDLIGQLKEKIKNKTLA